MEIVIRQSGGLGNQMFQYAAGRYYAKRYNATLRIATENQKHAHSLDDPRHFLLSKFKITAPFRELNTIEQVVLSTSSRIKPVGSLVAKYLRIQVVREPYTERYIFHADLPIRSGAHSVYLVGYWQVHRHLTALSDSLRNEFRFCEPPQGRNLEVLTQIQRTEMPVSIHIRRGDYLSIFGAASILPARYYFDAIRTITGRVSSPTFFVFSDDIAFAKQHIPVNTRTIFVDHNDSSAAHEDLRLMTACRHHIIANSTFSWWGAWLNPSAAKLVVAPERWLEPEIECPDLMPSDWILIGDRTLAL
jgi:hypothetical protein